jgi:hypothetical protein
MFPVVYWDEFTITPPHSPKKKIMRTEKRWVQFCRYKDGPVKMWTLTTGHFETMGGERIGQPILVESEPFEVDE